MIGGIHEPTDRELAGQTCGDCGKLEDCRCGLTYAEKWDREMTLAECEEVCAEAAVHMRLAMEPWRRIKDSERAKLSKAMEEME